MIASSGEIKKLIAYLDKIADETPRGLSSLKDSLTFAIMDMTIYLRTGNITESFKKAVKFARSIPVFDDLDSNDCAAWMLNDIEHLEYMPF